MPLQNLSAVQLDLSSGNGNTPYHTTWWSLKAVRVRLKSFCSIYTVTAVALLSQSTKSFHSNTHISIHCLPLRWRHNDRHGVSNHQPRDCLLNRLSDADKTKHQSSASLALMRGIHRGPVNFPHKWPVTRKMFPFDDVIMPYGKINVYAHNRAIWVLD